VSPRRASLGPLGWCIGAALLFGVSTPAAKPLVDATGALLLAGLLYAGAALAVLPAAARDWRRHRPPSKENRWRLLGAVLFGGLIGPAALLWGLSMAPAGSVSLWLTLETVATALLARLLFREHLAARGWIAVALVVVASAALADQPQLGVAVALVGIACVAWGLDNNLTSLIDGFTPAQITLIKGAVTAVVLLPIGLALGGRASPTQLLSALAVGAAGYGLSLVMYVAGAQQLGATRSQLLFSTAPLFGLVAAWLLLGEPLGWQHVGSAALMAIAVVLLHRERHAHEHRHDPVEHTHWHQHDVGHHDHAHPEQTATLGWHQHHHGHAELTHQHRHRPDLHHRHAHRRP